MIKSIYYEFFLLELTTGMRRGEILELQWKDVNFASGELHIRRQVVKKGAQTREECEEKLAELIKTMKAEIAEMKKVAKNA